MNPFGQLSGRLSAAISVLALAGCVSLPDVPASGNHTDVLPWRHQSRALQVAARSDFDPQQYDGLVLGAVQIRHADTAEIHTEDETLRRTLEQRLAVLPTGSIEKGLRMDIVLYDIRPVKPALNALSAVALFVPLDSGALTLEATFHDNEGNLLARRTERLSGSVVDIANGFSRYGRLNEALNRWAAQCEENRTRCAIAAK